MVNSLNIEVKNKTEENQALILDLEQTKSAFDKLEQDLKEKEAKFDNEIAILSEKNFALMNDIKNLENLKQELENSLNQQVESLQNSLNELEKSSKSQKELLIAEKNKELDDLKAQMQNELNTKIQELESKHAREIEELKIKYEGLRPSDDLLKGKMEKINLKYNGKEFINIPEISGSGIFLSLDKVNEKWMMSWTDDTSFVERRSAERVARSISKSGWQSVAGGARYGFGFELIIQAENVVPDDLLKDQHKYNE